MQERRPGVAAIVEVFSRLSGQSDEGRERVDSRGRGQGLERGWLC